MVEQRQHAAVSLNISYVTVNALQQHQTAYLNSVWLGSRAYYHHYPNHNDAAAVSKHPAYATSEHLGRRD